MNNMLDHETLFTKQILVQSIPTQKTSKQRHNDFAIKSKLITSLKVTSNSMACTLPSTLFIEFWATHN